MVHLGPAAGGKARVPVKTKGVSPDGSDYYIPDKLHSGRKRSPAPAPASPFAWQSSPWVVAFSWDVPHFIYTLPQTMMHGIVPEVHRLNPRH